MNYSPELASPRTLRERIQGIDISNHVTIVAEKLHDLIPMILQMTDKTTEPLQTRAETLDDSLQLQFFFNAMNFSYWPDRGGKKWQYNGEKIYTGSEGLFRALEAAQDTYKNWDTSRMAGINENDFNLMLTDTGIPMRHERFRYLTQAAADLQKASGDGTVLGMIRESNNDALLFLERLIINIPAYRDVSVWHGVELPFLKRAQLLVKCAHDEMLKHTGQGLQHMEALTAFSDYKVPYVFAHHGVLEYSDALRDKLAGMELLPKDSEEEVAIRIATVRVVDELASVLLQQGVSLNAGELDTIVWLLGREKPEGYVLPFHRTRTTAY